MQTYIARLDTVGSKNVQLKLNNTLIVQIRHSLLLYNSYFLNIIIWHITLYLQIIFRYNYGTVLLERCISRIVVNPLVSSVLPGEK